MIFKRDIATSRTIGPGENLGRYVRVRAAKSHARSCVIANGGITGPGGPPRSIQLCALFCNNLHTFTHYELPHKLIAARRGSPSPLAFRDHRSPIGAQRSIDSQSRVSSLEDLEDLSARWLLFNGSCSARGNPGQPFNPSAREANKPHGRITHGRRGSGDSRAIGNVHVRVTLSGRNSPKPRANRAVLRVEGRHFHKINHRQIHATPHFHVAGGGGSGRGRGRGGGEK